MREVRVQADPFDAGAEQARLVAGRTDIGAVVAFTGLCRDEAGMLAALEIEHYPGMAEAEITRVVDEAEARWPLAGVIVVHRHGRIAPGAPIVLVVTASRHRDAAFQAASFLMDYLKTRAPFWKKEHLVATGSGGWVAAKDADEEATLRWSERHPESGDPDDFRHPHGEGPEGPSRTTRAPDGGLAGPPRGSRRASRSSP